MIGFVCVWDGGGERERGSLNCGGGGGVDFKLRFSPSKLPLWFISTTGCGIVSDGGYGLVRVGCPLNKLPSLAYFYHWVWDS